MTVLGAMSEYQQRRKEHERRAARARRQEFAIDLSDVAKPMSMGIGLSPGQSGKIVLHAKGEHATTGAVHVALSEDGKLVFAVEHEPGLQVEQRPTVERPRWRFFDFWRYNRERHDNELRPEHEWPVLIGKVKA